MRQTEVGPEIGPKIGLELGRLSKGVKAVIICVGGDGFPVELTERLLEMGFLEGSLVEVIHEAPFGKDPLAIRVRGGLIALRRSEANAVQVRLLAPAPEELQAEELQAEGTQDAIL